MSWLYAGLYWNLTMCDAGGMTGAGGVAGACIRSALTADSMQFPFAGEA